MAPKEKEKPFGVIDKLDEKTIPGILKFTPPEVWQAAITAMREGKNPNEVLRPFMEHVTKVYDFKGDAKPQQLASYWLRAVQNASDAYDYAKGKYDEIPEPLNGAQLRSFLESQLRQGGVEPGSCAQTALVGMLAPKITEENREFAERQKAREEQKTRQWNVTRMTPHLGDHAPEDKLTLSLVRGDGTKKQFDVIFNYTKDKGPFAFSLKMNAEDVAEKIKQQAALKGCELRHEDALKAAKTILGAIAKERASQYK